MDMDEFAKLPFDEQRKFVEESVQRGCALTVKYLESEDHAVRNERQSELTDLGSLVARAFAVTMLPIFNPMIGQQTAAEMQGTTIRETLTAAYLLGRQDGRKAAQNMPTFVVAEEPEK